MTIGRIGFAYNPTNEAAIDLRERAEGWCRMHRIEHWAAQAQDFDALCADLPTTDVLVVLGGDGTFLRAARAVIDVDVPLLGVNLGKVGFLSKVEANELEGVLARLVAGEDGPAVGPSITLSTTSSSLGERSPASADSTSPSGRRTSPRSSPTASSSRARPARPATRSAPAVPSSTR